MHSKQLWWQFLEISYNYLKASNDWSIITWDRSCVGVFQILPSKSNMPQVLSAKVVQTLVTRQPPGRATSSSFLFSEKLPRLIHIKLVASPLWSHLPDPLDHSYIYGAVFSTRLWVTFQKHRMLFFMHKLIDIVMVLSGWVGANYLVSGEGNGNSLQYSCLENPTDRRAWRAAVHGVTGVGHDLGTKLLHLLPALPPSILFPQTPDCSQWSCN